ncbi:hypothetical protein DPEC_G00059820 [Dallia pectoralis]|uniref:Uncharacterized protein n=1 Tax=Dallia pectoralis TaxID=75939 RepID=A0ACC2H6K1_DALPE|nr:hypothetical protein DPEC_G00059820 [Dallia pectoralis]
MAAAGLNQEGELVKDLMRGYNKNVRPMEESGDITQVTIKMTLTNLISLQWCDYRLRWDQPPRADLYGNLTEKMRIPSKSICVDGKFEIAMYCNALVSSNGCVYWLPPAIYRSACSITVNYFPFDWQNCSMVFRSQSYNANEIELVLTEEDNQTVEWVAIDPEDFTENGEWIIKHRPAKQLINHRYTKDELEYQEVVFFLIIQRKPLFYVINIIVPCVLISSLGLLVYFLPAKAGGQKCTVSIMILLAQTIFLILIAKKVPETSQAVPLIGKYVMFVMSITIVIVMNCVVVLNVSLRSPNTHMLSNKTRKILLNLVPRVLRMQMRLWTPPEDCDVSNGTCNGHGHSTDGGGNVFLVPCRRPSSLGLITKAEEYVMKTARTELMFSKLRDREGLMKSALEKIYSGLDSGTALDLSVSLAQASPEVRQCVASCKHIAQTARQQNNFESENEEWFLVGRVIDRMCFIAMVLSFFLGTVGIFLTESWLLDLQPVGHWTETDRATSAVTSQPLPYGHLVREKHIDRLFKAFYRKQSSFTDPQSLPSSIPNQMFDQSLGETGHTDPRGAEGRETTGLPWAGGLSGVNGLALLDTVSQLRITARPELQGPQCVSHRTYSIASGDSSEELLVAVEESSCMCMQFCGPARACSIQGFDRQARQLFVFERPIRVDACCLGCCLMEIRVYTPQRQLIGSIRQRYPNVI